MPCAHNQSRHTGPARPAGMRVFRRGVTDVERAPMTDNADRDRHHRPDAIRPPGEPGFPRAARLELDELLEQLVARARDVQDTQGRLRGLLRANLTIAGA